MPAQTGRLCQFPMRVCAQCISVPKSAERTVIYWIAKNSSVHLMEEQSSRLQHIVNQQNLRHTPRASIIPNQDLKYSDQTRCNPNHRQANYPHSHAYESRQGVNMGHRYGNADGNVALDQYLGFGQPNKSNFLDSLNPALFSELTQNDPKAISQLNDKVIALQMANFKLNLYLKSAETKRKSAEDDLFKERTYVKKLEDNITNLRKSRVIMDPMTYQQVADDYIASRKRPVRRTHTCHPWIGQSDLVCDQPITTQSQAYGTVSSSCPSSPLGANGGRHSRDEGSIHSSNTRPSVYSKSEDLGVTRDHELSCHSLPNTTDAPTDHSSGQEKFEQLLESLKRLSPSSSPP